MIAWLKKVWNAATAEFNPKMPPDMRAPVVKIERVDPWPPAPENPDRPHKRKD